MAGDKEGCLKISQPEGDFKAVLSVHFIHGST